MTADFPPSTFASTMPTRTAVERVAGLSDWDLTMLVRAAEAAIAEGRANWTRSPGQSALEKFFRGVMLAPHRDLFVARLDGRVVGALQLVQPPPLSETGPYSGELTSFFIAPTARGHGLARALIEIAEERARALSLKLLDVSVRADREAAQSLIRSLGYKRWALKSHYAYAGGGFIAGAFFTKDLDDPAGLSDEDEDADEGRV